MEKPAKWRAKAVVRSKTFGALYTMAKGERHMECGPDVGEERRFLPS